MKVVHGAWVEVEVYITKHIRVFNYFYSTLYSASWGLRREFSHKDYDSYCYSFSHKVGKSTYYILFKCSDWNLKMRSTW